MATVLELACECGGFHVPVFGKRLNRREVGIVYWCPKLGRHIIATFKDDGTIDLYVATYGQKGEGQ